MLCVMIDDGERERTQRSTTDLGRRQFSCLQVYTSAAASCMVTRSLPCENHPKRHFGQNGEGAGSD